MWKSKHLSSGKLTLINSVIVPTASYFMQCSLFSKSVCISIDKVVRDFLWDDIEGTIKIHLVGWGKICKSKQCGGLGIPSFFHKNIAFLIKLCWLASLILNLRLLFAIIVCPLNPAPLLFWGKAFPLITLC